MQERHHNRKLYFDEQAYTTQKYVVPYMQQLSPITPQTRILEIGCGEGGNLKPFVDLGCQCVGIDLNKEQIENAKLFFSDNSNKDNLELIYSDIYNIDYENFKFDIIFLRDVIEHIHNQDKFMAFVKKFMKPNGIIFFAFPPWLMPFGGHQQVCKSKLSKMPWIHLLSPNLYTRLLTKAGDQNSVSTLLEIKETGITIERFEHILKKHNYSILKRDLFFINPNYEIKFGLKPCKVLPLFRSIPYFRDFYTTAAYYLTKI